MIYTWSTSPIPVIELISYCQIHWPVSFAHSDKSFAPIDPTTKRIRLADVPVGDTWAAMEKLVGSGKIRSIGVSNFTVEKIEALLRTAKIPPAVNEVEAHPYLQQPKLVNYMKEKVGLPLHAFQELIN